MPRKQIIQLSVVTFSFYVIIFFMMTGGWEYYNAYGMITLFILLGLYIIYSQKDNKLIKYLRILLYIILGYLIYSIINNITSLYGFELRVFYNETPLKVFWELFQDGFNLFYVLITSAALLLNKPSKPIILKIGKLKISF